MVSANPMAPTVRSYAQLKAAGSTSTPVKSLLRSALSTKRRADDADLDSQGDEGTPVSHPAKRAKTVIFSPHNEIRIITMPPDPMEPLDDIKQSVRRALEEHIRPGGDDTRYAGLKEIFSKSTRKQTKADNDNMKAHLLALTSCASLISKSCSGLVRAILKIEWLGQEWSFVRIYVDFLANLASAQAVYLADILDKLADYLSGVKKTSGRLVDCLEVSRPQLLFRVHFALKYLLRLFPAAPGTLSPILKEKFPFIDSSRKVHMTFIHNLIRILEYAPELKSDILALITEKLVAIDVRTMVDFEDEDPDVSEAATAACAFGSNEDDVDSEYDSSSDSSDDEAPGAAARKERRISALEQNIWKQDDILDVLFELYSPYFANPESTTAIAMFDTLLSHFRNIILPTYRSRHTQFLLFHFAQTSEHLIDTFAGECVDLAFKSGRPAVLKQSAAAFLASFVARGAHVLPHVVRDVFNFIGVNLDIIRVENEATCRGPDLQRYSTFYATTQALLYIFCFRWRDLIVPPGGPQYDEDGNEIEVEIDVEDLVGPEIQWRNGVRELLQRTIYSKLNPLKVCSPLVVGEFARTAKALEFMMVFPLISANKKVRLSQFTTGNKEVLRDAMCGQDQQGKSGEAWHQLDAYFPFDPYKLPKSRRWVEGDYLDWNGPPGALDFDEDGNTEEDSDDEEDEEESDSSGEDDDDETATEDED